MDSARVDAIMQYAIAVARCAHDDEWKLRSLGEIHLLKYAYIADLAHAQKFAGASFTGTDWIFYHFGPWAQQAQDRVSAAMAHIAAESAVLDGEHGPYTRWTFRNLTDAERVRDTVGRSLPPIVASAIASAVKRHGNVTSDLLHEVYQTPPMLRAAPGERLDLAVMVTSKVPVAVARHHTPLRTKAIKRRQEHMTAARRRVAERVALLQKDKQGSAGTKPPRYDDIFYTGIAAMDEAAGSDMTREGQLVFGDGVWRSAIRSEPDE